MSTTVRGIKEIGPNFIGLENYKSLFESDLFKYAGNTLLLWLIGFIPQIVIALLLANWFTDMRLKIRGKQFFKVVIYLPNLIMASAFAMLFFRPVLQQRPHQLDPDVHGDHPGAHRLYGHGLWHPQPGGPDELPDVVRQHHHHADGGDHGHQP